MRRREERRARALLAAGVLLGAGLAAADVVERTPGEAALGDGVVALVGGRPISRAALERGLRALATDRRGGAEEGDRARVLERLIDEELLVQRALELGLAERDRRVRADLVAAMIDALTARAAEEGPPDEAELEAFYRSEAAYFRRPARARVEQLFFRASEGAAERAEAAREALAGGAELASIEADDPPLALPARWLSRRELVEALGPTAAEAVAGLAEGEVSEPVAGPEGYRVLRLVARRGGELPPLSENRDVALAEYRRRAGERALRAFLAERRLATEIVVPQGS